MEAVFEEYAAFENKVKQSVYIDNLSPLAKESVIKAALDQFGNVIQVTLIRTYLELKGMGRAALVEMQNADEARTIISEIRNSPFMISGMPRPVRARPAVVEMFDDRPRKPDRMIMCYWLKSNDPDFEVATKMKRIVRNHAKEANFLLKTDQNADFRNAGATDGHHARTVGGFRGWPPAAPFPEPQKFSAKS
ncbi:hypothetical protein MTR67_017437 [Solanum verrucosum]|uniref:RRM domain-containing protein n=1 Tax=Solanum verrucosum TaxID=315347 RepID=A0AAF0TKS2_SOLVR|nr:hypothetical protein MTR67_017437 [Solanum verrucosum]